MRKYQTREWQLCCTISSYQDMLAEGPPSWERDRNVRCEREIRKASAELVEIMVRRHRKRMAQIHKRCERYTAERLAKQAADSANAGAEGRREPLPTKPGA